MARKAIIRKFPSYTTIIDITRPTNNIYFILEGQVKITTVSILGREVRHATLGAGQHFGEMSALDKQPHCANVTSVKYTIAAAVNHQIFLNILEKDADLSLWFMQSLCSRLRIANRRLYETISMTIFKRVCIKLVRNMSDTFDNGGELRMKPSPIIEQWAKQLNCNRENISKAFSLLQDKGIIQKNKSDLVVLNWQLLSELATS